MNPPVEALAAAPDVAPSLAGAVLRIVFVVALLAAGAWALLRWQKRLQGPRRQVRLLDRVMLARGASVALVEVAGKRLLLGVTGEGVRLLRDLDPKKVPKSRFEDTLAAVASREEAGR